MRIPTLATTVSAWAFGLALIAGISPASAIDVTSLSSGGGTDVWRDGTFDGVSTRNGGSVTLSSQQSPDGDGSLRLSMPGASAKATAIYTGTSVLGKLEYLTSVTYQYYRDPASTNSNVQAPSLRLVVSDGEGRQGFLVYEPVYNGGAPVPEGSWQTADATTGHWWLYEGGVFENFGLTLSDWITDEFFDNSTGTVSKQGFGEDALILGIEIGVGSGWAGDTLAFVDNINLSFLTDDKNETSFSWNFRASTTPVPEPATLALMGAGLAGLWIVRRRRSV